jgi:integrase
MGAKNFTELSVRSLPLGTYFEKATPAFGLRVGKTKRTWFIVRRGKRRTLGHFPHLSVADARKKARRLQCADPNERPAISFPEALDEFLDLHGKTIRPSSKYVLERSLRRHFTWTKNLDLITHRDVLSVIDAIEGKSAACHALKDIRALFNWCVPRYLSHSPATGLRMPAKYIPRDRLLSDDEIKRIWKAAGEVDWYGQLIKLLILTGQRCNQILSLKDSWIKADTIEFPAVIMKGGKAHVIPFSKHCRSLIPSYRPTTFQSKKKRELDKLTGINEPYTLHDFRRYFASKMAEIGTPLHITERLLAHRSGTFSGIVSVYQKYDFAKEMADAMMSYEQALASFLDIEPSRAAAA